MLVEVVYYISTCDDRIVLTNKMQDKFDFVGQMNISDSQKDALF
jgi:predicted RNA-binding protein